MALDGIVISNIVAEMKEKIQNGKISKLAQPESDELLITIKNGKEQHRLLISAGASLPLIYFTQKNKPSPMTAPNFCMLLRKHIGNGRIVAITQPGLERIIMLEIEHLDELGDRCRKLLIIELMGKHSNIIFCNSESIIIDSIKHVSAQMSSVREVLPGRPYFIPKTIEKADPLTITEAEFNNLVLKAPVPVGKAIYNNLTGISPLLAEEICYLASIDSALPTAALSMAEGIHLFHMFRQITEAVKTGRYTPNIIYKAGEPVEFSSLLLSSFKDLESQTFHSISEVLETYYASKNTITRIRQKSADLRRIVQTALERNRKKYDLQLKQLKDTNKREKYRIYGELINTYGYGLSGKETSLTAPDYYHDNQEIVIPLDETLSAQDNAKKYFERYNKLKRTYEALTDLIDETKSDIDHLESISASLDIALQEEDLAQIKEELMESGYMKRKHPGNKKIKSKSKPFHYLSSDGFHIYVGKNNYQNDDLTFNFSSANDWWFHAKGIPGSHVIVKSEGKELPDRVFEEAGQLAAYYSKGRENEKVEIDYTERRNVKKPSGGKPGFVIYHTNYSLVAAPKLLSEIKA